MRRQMGGGRSTDLWSTAYGKSEGTIELENETTANEGAGIRRRKARTDLWVQLMYGKTQKQETRKHDQTELILISYLLVPI